MTTRRAYTTTFLHEDTRLAADITVVPWSTLNTTYEDATPGLLIQFVLSGLNHIDAEVSQPRLSLSGDSDDPIGGARDFLATVVRGATTGSATEATYASLDSTHRSFVDEMAHLDVLAVEESRLRTWSFALLIAAGAGVGPDAVADAESPPNQPPMQQVVVGEPTSPPEDEGDWDLGELVTGRAVGFANIAAGAVIATVAKHQGGDLNQWINVKLRPGRRDRNIKRRERDLKTAIARIEADRDVGHLNETTAQKLVQDLRAAHYQWLASGDAGVQPETH